MPGKSRRAKAKQYYAKKNRTEAPGNIEATGTTEGGPATAAASAPTGATTRAAVSPRTSSARGTPVILHQYIGAELKKIFILAAIMLVIIIVLARVFA